MHLQLIEKHSAELVEWLGRPNARPELLTETPVAKLVGWTEMLVAMLVEWPRMLVVMLAELLGMHFVQPVGRCLDSEALESHFEDAVLVG